jgi:hypothetical protein
MMNLNGWDASTVRLLQRAQTENNTVSAATPSEGFSAPPAHHRHCTQNILASGGLGVFKENPENPKRIWQIHTNAKKPPGLATWRL